MSSNNVNPHLSARGRWRDFRLYISALQVCDDDDDDDDEAGALRSIVSVELWRAVTCDVTARVSSFLPHRSVRCSHV